MRDKQEAVKQPPLGAWLFIHGEEFSQLINIEGMASLISQKVMNRSSKGNNKKQEQNKIPGSNDENFHTRNEENNADC